VSEAEIWVEQVRLDLSTPLDRGRAAGRQDAVGEIIRLVDTIAGDDAKMKRWLEAELGELLNAMPPEVTAGEVPSWDDLGELRGLLMDAEATVLARLAPAGGDG
jgi:exonuclease SbcD